MNRVIIPLDVPTVAEAFSLVDQLGDDADFYKVGFELFTRGGPQVVNELVSRGKRVFLDLKLHKVAGSIALTICSGT